MMLFYRLSAVDLRLGNAALQWQLTRITFLKRILAGGTELCVCFTALALRAPIHVSVHIVDRHAFT